jgi:hypothetical protein
VGKSSSLIRWKKGRVRVEIVDTHVIKKPAKRREKGKNEKGNEAIGDAPRF